MKKSIQYFCGSIFRILFQEKYQKLLNNFTIPQFDSTFKDDFTSRCMREHILQQQYKNNLGTETLHQKFWATQQPGQWYESTADRFESIHVPVIQPFAENITTLLEQHQIDRVVEFGCGNGTWLDHLKKTWIQVKDFHGVDISTAQIIENKKQLPHLNFSAAEINEWVQANASSNTLYHTNCGVLEYLTRKNVEKLFSKIAKDADKTIFFLVEPLAEGFNIESNTDSVLFGEEASYSHNYPLLLKNSGYSIIEQTEIDIEGYRMIIISAVSPV